MSARLILAVVLAASAAGGPARAADLRSERPLLVLMQAELAQVAAQVAAVAAELRPPAAAPDAGEAR